MKTFERNGTRYLAVLVGPDQDERYANAKDLADYYRAQTPEDQQKIREAMGVGETRWEDYPTATGSLYDEGILEPVGKMNVVRAVGGCFAIEARVASLWKHQAEELGRRLGQTEPLVERMRKDRDEWRSKAEQAETTIRGDKIEIEWLKKQIAEPKSTPKPPPVRVGPECYGNLEHFRVLDDLARRVTKLEKAQQTP